MNEAKVAKGNRRKRGRVCISKGDAACSMALALLAAGCYSGWYIWHLVAAQRDS